MNPYSVAVAPFAVPLGAFVVAIVAIIAGAMNQAHTRRIKAEQRMAMLARGLPLEDIERLVGSAGEPERQPRDINRSMSNARRTALVLISSGIGIILFFVALRIILHEPGVLAGAPIGLVPLVIGLGFWVDYRLQAREVARLGLHVPETAETDRLR